MRSKNKEVLVSVDGGDSWDVVAPFSAEELRSPVDDTLKIFQPPTRLNMVVFGASPERHKIGELYEGEDGRLYFDGDAEESAKVFFDEVCRWWLEEREKSET